MSVDYIKCNEEAAKLAEKTADNCYSVRCALWRELYWREFKYQFNSMVKG
jgi:hypothetical protein